MNYFLDFIKKMIYWYDNGFRAESIKMYMRLFYAFILWYELIVQADLGHYDEDYEGNDKDWNEEFLSRKLGLIIIYSIMFIWNIAEKYCYGGTRPLVKLGGIYVVLHFILALVPIYWVYWPIINGLLCTINVLYFHMRWVNMGENDMSSFKLMGPFRPGIKRFKAEEFGNDCILFYPAKKEAN